MTYVADKTSVPTNHPLFFKRKIYIDPLWTKLIISLVRFVAVINIYEIFATGLKKTTIDQSLASYNVRGIVIFYWSLLRALNLYFNTH